MTRAESLAIIARKTLGVHTLETRRSDSLDFYDLAVWSISSALEAAYEAGKEDAELEAASLTKLEADALRSLVVITIDSQEPQTKEEREHLAALRRVAKKLNARRS